MVEDRISARALAGGAGPANHGRAKLECF